MQKTAVTLRATPNDCLSEIISRAAPGTRIVLRPGVYREKLEISVSNIQLIGNSPEDTKIVYGDYAKKLDKRGIEYNTFRTYTAAVFAPGVTFRNLTVENDALCPEKKGQEVALSVCADGFLAENCRFVSTQDTVFCGPLPCDLMERYRLFLKAPLRAGGEMRQVFRNCFIAGNVDFIFGCGDTLFEKCEVRSIFDKRGHGFAAAPAHSREQKIGFVFDRCRFTCESRVEDESVYLARPWRSYGKCSFIGCTYGRHIARQGFDKWNDTERDKTARFAEYGDTPDGRAEWSRKLSEAETAELIRAFQPITEKGQI